MAKIGPKEQQVAALRAARFEPGRRKSGIDEAKAAVAVTKAADAAKQESDVTKKKTTKKTTAKKVVKKKAPARKATAAKKAKREPVPAQKIADYIVGAGTAGRSMEDLVGEFGIEAHPMRAKIHYCRTKLLIAIECVGGRYYGPGLAPAE